VGYSFKHLRGERYLDVAAAKRILFFVHVIESTVTNPHLIPSLMKGTTMDILNLNTLSRTQTEFSPQKVTKRNLSLLYRATLTFYPPNISEKKNTMYLNDSRFRLRDCRLIVTTRKFDVLQGATICISRPIPRRKHSIPNKFSFAKISENIRRST